MGLADTHLDVLQNIEFAIVSVFCKQSNLVDYNVMRALDGLISLYRADSPGQSPKEIKLQGLDELVFERAYQMCEFRLGRSKVEINGRVQCVEAAISVDELIACLRKIRRSVEKWNKHGGRQGYLNFVAQFVK